MSEDIMVSVCMLAYNHEKYIRKAIESILSQKTNFKFELLIHDDASTDSTPDIIREYETKYPEIVKPIYQKENQYSKKIKISRTYQYPRAKGEYIAFCEGDDYWSDENKLQIQYSEMEKRKNCVICVHDTQAVKENDTIDKFKFSLHLKYQGTVVISKKDFMNIMVSKNNYPVHTTSFFIRKNVLDEFCQEQPEFVNVAMTGDIPLLMYLATKGDMLYIQKDMSHYRKCAKGSFSVRTRRNKEYAKLNFEKQIESYKLYDKYTNYLMHEEIEELIRHYEFRIFTVDKNIKAMKRPEHRDSFNCLSSKRRLYYNMSLLFPFLLKIEEVRKGR